MKEFDPLLEVSNLTDDSKLLLMFANEANALKHSQPQKTMPKSKLHQKGIFSIFETRNKSSVITRASSTTPETVPLDEDEDNDRLDDISDDSKYRRQSLSEVSIRVDDFKIITFEKLVMCLCGNDDLSTVEVTRLHSVSNQRCRTQKEMTLFFAAVRSLPNLTKLILNSFTTDDLDLICAFVRGHHTLEKIHVHLISGTVNTALLGILSEVASLKEVSLDVQSTFPLYLLLSSNSLVRIAVPSATFSFKERHLVLTMQALAKNTTIRILDLQPKMSPSDVRLLSFGIRGNTHLRVLRFSFLAEETEAGPALIHLCEVIATNSSLRTVENHYSKLLGVTQVDAYRMLKSLACNNTLKLVDLFDDERAAEDMDDDAPSAWEDNVFSRLMCNSDFPLFFFSSETCHSFGGRCSGSRSVGSKNLSTEIREIPNKLQRTILKWLETLKQ